MRILAIVISVLILIGFDMSSKYFIEENLFGTGQSICSSPETNSAATTEYCDHDRISLLGDYFGIEVSYNTGVAFSLPIRGLALQVLTVILICGIIYQYIREEYIKISILLDIGYTLIIG
jgi:lipoprotein signal peptidase